jgi:hypothetical protein
MSTSSNGLSSVRRPFSVLPQALQAPFLGVVWVFSNVALIALGIKTGYHITCHLVAGAADGAILAVIVIATVSEKFQAGVTGLLSGYGYGNIVTGFAPVKRVLAGLHAMLDSSLDVLTPLPHDEQLHETIQDAAMWIMVTVLVVVLAALVVQWIRMETSRSRSDSPRLGLDA